MELTNEQKDLLKVLMTNSAQKGNLANAGLVLENGIQMASAESWVVSSCDATAHSERMLVELVCKIKHSNYTPGLTMITITEPCLMCLSACAWAGYKEIWYIIPAEKYLAKIPWMSEISIDKRTIAKSFSDPIDLIHLRQYEDEFSRVFEESMSSLLI